MGTYSRSERYSLQRSVICSRLSLKISRVTSGPLASSMTNLWKAQGLMCLAPRMSGVARMGADIRRSGGSFGIACPCPLAC